MTRIELELIQCTQIVCFMVGAALKTHTVGNKARLSVSCCDPAPCPDPGGDSVGALDCEHPRGNPTAAATISGEKVALTNRDDRRRRRGVRKYKSSKFEQR